MSDVTVMFGRKVRKWDRNEIARYTLDAFSGRISSGNTDVRVNGKGEVCLRFGTMGTKMSRAQRYHGDLRYVS